MIFFSVITLDCDVFETTILDERRFASLSDARAYAEMQADVVIIVKMQVPEIIN